MLLGKLHTCMINLQLDQYHLYYVTERVCRGQGGNWGMGEWRVHSSIVFLQVSAFQNITLRQFF